MLFFLPDKMTENEEGKKKQLQEYYVIFMAK